MSPRTQPPCPVEKALLEPIAAFVRNTTEQVSYLLVQDLATNRRWTEFFIRVGESIVDHFVECDKKKVDYHLRVDSHSVHSASVVFCLEFRLETNSVAEGDRLASGCSCPEAGRSNAWSFDVWFPVSSARASAAFSLMLQQDKWHFYFLSHDGSCLYTVFRCLNPLSREDVRHWIQIWSSLENAAPR